MAYYKNLGEYIKALEDKNKLVRVSRPINKDTELHPLVRLQFRALPEEERKAFYFDNVYDSKGKKYSIPVAVAVLGASPQVYAIGMMCEVPEIGQRWQNAMLHPIEPVIVREAPVQEVVFSGENLLERGGLSEFPIPISTPGWDIAPYLTSPYWVSKDPESGIRNVGTYRAQVKSPTRTGCYAAKPFRGIAYHWRKAKKLGKPLETAIVIGAPPNIGFASVSQLPTDVDEFTVAGGIAGEPVELVKCKTVDIEVPAHAEIVIEGEISTEEIEPEAPFGEATGYEAHRDMAFYFTVKCITHRRNPIWQAFISQYPPSESSVVRTVATANVIPNKLRYELKMPFVQEVAVHLTNTVDRYVVLKLAKTEPDEVWRALEAMPEHFPAFSKIIIAVDEDIDPWDLNMVNWAMIYRAQPHRDMHIVKIPAPDVMDYSVDSPAERELVSGELPSFIPVEPDKLPVSSCLLVNATMKWLYPPISLPKKEYMEGALKIWQELGLPQLGKLRDPWYGYSLGYWSEEYEKQAQLAVKSEYYQTGEMLAKKRRKV